MKNPVLQLQEPHFKYLAAIVASGFYAVQIQAVFLFLSTWMDILNLWYPINAKVVNKIIEKRVMLTIKTKIQHVFNESGYTSVWNRSFDNKKKSEWQSINQAVRKSAVLQLSIFNKRWTRGNRKIIDSHD